MIIEKTTTIKDGKNTYTNNLEQTCITKNDKIIQPFCILDIDQVITIKQGRTISQTSRDDPRIQHIIDLLLNPPKKEQTKTTTKKTTKQSKTSKRGKGDEK